MSGFCLTPGAADAGSGNDTREPYYQLTHDYLVPSLRNWLTRKRQETRRGRAELRLEERATLWNTKPESRFLPSLHEYLSMRFLTRPAARTRQQQSMLKAAGRVHGVRCGSLLLGAIVVGLTTWHFVSTARRQNDVVQATGTVTALQYARGELVPRAVEELEALPRDVVLQQLRESYIEQADVKEKLPLSYGLAHYNDVHVEFLISAVQDSSPREVENLIAALARSPQESLRRLREAALVCQADQQWRHMARLATLALQLGDPSLAISMCRFRSDPIQRSTFSGDSRHSTIAEIADTQQLTTGTVECLLLLCYLGACQVN